MHFFVYVFFPQVKQSKQVVTMALTPPFASYILKLVILVVGGALEIKINHNAAVLCNLTKEAHSPLCSSTPLVVTIKNNNIFSC